MCEPPEPQPDKADGLYQQAARELAAGTPAIALSTIRKALALRPREIKCHELVGQIYLSMGKELLARRAFAQARDLAPETATREDGPEGPETLANLDTPDMEDAPAPPDDALEPGERRMLLEMTQSYLARLATLEELARSVPDNQGATTLSEVKRELVQQLQRARTLWRAEQQAQEGSQAASSLPAEVPEDYRKLCRFTHTLGTAAGAVSQGAEISDLQRLLNLEGCPVPVSGRYDQRTVVAVKQLQEKYRLISRDGAVGRETRQLLNRLTAHD